MSQLSDQQLLRYSRQILLPELDVAGQQKLLNGRVMIVGLGGLGSPVALYLAAAGVGKLILVDDDVVDQSNLQRQIAHTEAQIDEAKVTSAAASIERINSMVAVTTLQERPGRERLAELLADVDAVVDCSDNFTTRFLLNQVCAEQRTPLVSGAAIRMEGQVTVFDFRRDDSPCYRCLYPPQADEDLSCAASGVMAPLVGVIGSVQALETIKVLTGIGTPLVGRVQFYDALHSQWREIRLQRDPGCPVCSER